MEFIYLGFSLALLVISVTWRRLWWLAIPSLIMCIPIFINETYDGYFRAGVVLYFVLVGLRIVEGVFDWAFG